MPCLCSESFFLFSRGRLHQFVLSALDVGEFKGFDSSIYWNLRKLSLFILYVQGHNFESLWLWDVNVGTTIFHWLYFDFIYWLPVLPVVTDSLVFIPSNIGINGKVFWWQNPKEWAQTEEWQCTVNTISFIFQGKYSQISLIKFVYNKQAHNWKINFCASRLE